MDPARYPITPWPRTIDGRDGAFTPHRGLRVSLSDGGNADLRRLGDLVAAHLRDLCALDVSVGPGGPITLALRSDAPAGPEAYLLDVDAERIDLVARDPRGLFYGAQTLRQLAASAPNAIPSVRIEDAPRFAWRGLHLDVGRHFFPVEFIKKYIDLLATFKLNVFHWHLTEDQGWRLEIKKYPKLTEIGAWRKETIVGHARRRPKGYDGIRHGGFYTQQQAREVVAYARERGVTVVPEIEMPGHSLAALAAYPDERFLNANGRRLVGWDEIIEGGLAPNATVMSWRGTKGGIAAAKERHDVVMAPQQDLYFDHYQADPEHEPLAIGGMTPIEDTYAYEPIAPELSADEARYVIGTQGCVWTEYMATTDHVEYMTYPRALALAEIAWSPREARDWSSFEKRLPAALRLLDRLGVCYRRPK